MSDEFNTVNFNQASLIQKKEKAFPVKMLISKNPGLKDTILVQLNADGTSNVDSKTLQKFLEESEVPEGQQDIMGGSLMWLILNAIKQNENNGIKPEFKSSLIGVN